MRPIVTPLYFFVIFSTRYGNDLVKSYYGDRSSLVLLELCNFPYSHLTINQSFQASSPKRSPHSWCSAWSKSKSKEQNFHFGPKQNTKVIWKPPSHHHQTKTFKEVPGKLNPAFLWGLRLNILGLKSCFIRETLTLGLKLNTKVPGLVGLSGLQALSQN